MLNRVMLDLAARALDRELNVPGSGSLAPPFYWSDERSSDENAIYWNPLEDDGDALRLVICLNLLVQVTGSVTFVTDIDGKQLAYKPHKKIGPFVATRYAITRAAAVIGGSK